MIMVLKRHFVVLMVAVILGGCASQPSIQASNPNGILTYGEISSALEKGTVRLDCGTSCSGSWGKSRRELTRLYDAKQWQDLAIKVISIGFNGQLPYFYLGRAAENLGMYDAAMIYYIRAEDRYACAGLLNVCNGFDVPAEIQKSRAAIANLRASKASEAPARSLSIQSMPAAAGPSAIQTGPAVDVQSPPATMSISEAKPQTTQQATRNPIPKRSIPQAPQKISGAAVSTPPAAPPKAARPSTSGVDAAIAEGTRDGARFAYDLKRIGEKADGTACAVGMGHEAGSRSHYSQTRLEAYAKAFGNACTGRKVF